MQDKELYKQLLGLQMPWEVSEIVVDFENLIMDVWIIWPLEKMAHALNVGE